MICTVLTICFDDISEEYCDDFRWYVHATQQQVQEGRQVNMATRTHGTAGKKLTGGQQMAFDDMFPTADLAVPTSTVAKPVKKASPVPSAIKLVAQHVTRDTFSMPSSDYGLIEQLRVRAAREGRNTNKSEVIRAGLRGLLALESADLVGILNRLEKVKPGRK
jgi:hypothetical protein